MLVEHARSVIGIADAVHAEYGETGSEVVSALSCSLDGVEIEVRLRPGTRLHGLYGGADVVVEHTTCNYGLNPDYQARIEESGLVISATDETGEARAVELAHHPFFVATLYQPQLRSSVDTPHPVLAGLVAAALAR